MSNQPPQGIPVGNPQMGNPGPAKKPNLQSTSSKKAITSLVLGLASFICMFLSGIAAVILGIMALSDISSSNDRLKGRGIAITGIVLGALGCLWTLPVILMALLMPAVSQVRDAARAAQSMNNMKEMALAMHNYHDNHMNFPPGRGANSELSWRVHILPYIDEVRLYDEFHLDEPWDSPHNMTLIDRMPEIYVSPSVDLDSGKTVFVVPTSAPSSDPAVRRNSAAFIQGEPGPKLQDFVDGTTKTILILEVSPEAAVTWTKPEDWEFDPDNPMRSLGIKNGRFVATFVDGSTQRIETSISPETLKALFTRSAGDIGFY